MYKRDWARVHATYNNRLGAHDQFESDDNWRYYETDLSSSTSSLL